MASLHVALPVYVNCSSAELYLCTVTIVVKSISVADRIKIPQDCCPTKNSRAILPKDAHSDLFTLPIGIGHCTVAVHIRKNRKKAKITKNRSNMVVSDHNEPVRCKVKALLRLYNSSITCAYSHIRGISFGGDEG